MARFPRTSVVVLIAVVTNVCVNVTEEPGEANALVDRQIPPSPAALVPFCQTISVLAVRSAASNTTSSTLRLPVFGLSNGPPAVDTLIRSTPIDPIAPVAALRRYRPRNPSGGIVPPSGASQPMPITPPAVLANR